ncbi:tRNA 2-thiouridine(34) synthase MnmA [Candidatus Uhrbacteria bacterium]|nr:tRNA 2-thiouridine(34) synthase MnmA [Candidatus Uhrbacteria bacterium]
MSVNGKKVLVLMSGGVDSSVSAGILHTAGYRVCGVYLKLWQAGDGRQQAAIGEECWAKELRDAARAAAHFGIPFQVWDVTEDYKARVLQDFYAQYAVGRTPNPDVLCNSEIKFGVALDRALREGYDYVATGHYARIVCEQRAKSKEQRAIEPYALRPTLYAGVDANKDQSYFLWRLKQDQLRHVLFPVGDYTKPQVRALAEKFGLHNAGKKDSQGVCFLGKIELKEFLKGEVAEQAGPIYDVYGKLLGTHDGLAHFTVGQREGIGIGGSGPYFVIDKAQTINALIVVHESEEQDWRTVSCQVGELNWSAVPPVLVARVSARTRYRASLCEAQIAVNSTHAEVYFDMPQWAVTPGQSIVFYEGDRVLGGGVIEKVKLTSSLPNWSNFAPAVQNSI